MTLVIVDFFSPDRIKSQLDLLACAPPFTGKTPEELATILIEQRIWQITGESLQAKQAPPKPRL